MGLRTSIFLTLDIVSIAVPGSAIAAREYLLLTERGTVTGTVLSGDADLLCALRHFGGCDELTSVEALGC